MVEDDEVSAINQKSILTDIKKTIGVEEDDTSFDEDLIIFINSELSILNQLGVGPEEGYSITSKENKWSEIIGERKDLAFVQTYIHIQVKLVFDPHRSWLGNT